MNDLKKNESNVVPFARVSTSDDGSFGNWLRNMKQGTRFLATRRSEGGSRLCDFVVASDPKAMPAVFIGEDINSPTGGFRFVDPDKFIKDYGFYMTLEVLEPPNGNNNQVQTSTVAGDAVPEEQPEVHAGKQRVPTGTKNRKVRPSPGKEPEDT